MMKMTTRQCCAFVILCWTWHAHQKPSILTERWRARLGRAGQGCEGETAQDMSKKHTWECVVSVYKTLTCFLEHFTPRVSNPTHGLKNFHFYPVPCSWWWWWSEYFGTHSFSQVIKLLWEPLSWVELPNISCYLLDTHWDFVSWLHEAEWGHRINSGQ